MNRILTAIVCVSLASWSYADSVKVGGHAAYLLGGDLPADTLGYGAQVEAYVNDVLSLQISGTQFTDDNSDIALDMLTVGASLRLSGRPAEGIEVYAGGGANYNVPRVVRPAVEGTGIAAAIGYHYCGGVTLGILDHFELFAEYRGSSVPLRAPGNAEVADFLGDSYDFGLVMVGLLFPL